jgi:hypothetical protein
MSAGRDVHLATAGNCSKLPADRVAHLDREVGFEYENHPNCAFSCPAQPENSATCSPSSMYSISKLLDELTAMSSGSLPDRQSIVDLL